MARRIVDAGFPTTLWARRPASLEPFDDTAASVAASPAELGAACDVLGVCVVDDAGVDEVLRGPDGALASMADGSVVVVHSTVHPATCLRLQEDFPAPPRARRSGQRRRPQGGRGRAARDGRRRRRGGRPVSGPCWPRSATRCSTSGRSARGRRPRSSTTRCSPRSWRSPPRSSPSPRSRGLDRQAVATILSSGSGRSYAAEVVTGSGFDLEGLAPVRRRPAGQGRRHPRRPGRPRRHRAARRRRPGPRPDGRGPRLGSRVIARCRMVRPPMAGFEPVTTADASAPVAQRAPAGARGRAPLRHARHRRRVAPPDRGRGRIGQQLGGPLPLRLEARAHRRDLPPPPARRSSASDGCWPPVATPTTCAPGSRPTSSRS